MSRVPSEAVRTKMKESHFQRHSWTFKGRKSPTCTNANSWFQHLELLSFFKNNLNSIQWLYLSDIWIVSSPRKSFPPRLRTDWNWFHSPFRAFFFFLTGLKILWINSKRSDWRRWPSPTKSLHLTIDYWEFMWHGSWSDGEPRYLETIRREGTVFTSLPATAWTYERRSSTSCFLLLVLLRPARHGPVMTRTIIRRNPPTGGAQELLPPRDVFEVYKEVKWHCFCCRAI